MSKGIRIEIANNPDELVIKAFHLFVQIGQETLGEKDRFSIAISGGSTPRPLYRKMGEEPWRSKIPWERTHIFWVDERCVPPLDPASNYGAAKSDFLDRIPIPPGQIHPMPGELDPAEGARRYENDLKSFFGLKPGAVPVFDFMLLGIGKDGHMASLFPGQKSLDEKKSLVISVTGGDPLVPRLTMTYPLINHARHAVFLVSGRGKAEVLRAILEYKDETLPAHMIQPKQGKVTWLLDRDAASMLSEGLLHEKS
ncbi:MAG: 6-phosphogluconolactonase [Deltaproteobacteria bacterium]|nr:6-phosphogluconolactonase [Deltaproteobacteria bacterium]